MPTILELTADAEKKALLFMSNFLPHLPGCDGVDTSGLADVVEDCLAALERLTSVALKQKGVPVEDLFRHTLAQAVTAAEAVRAVSLDVLEMVDILNARATSYDWQQWSPFEEQIRVARVEVHKLLCFLF